MRHHYFLFLGMLLLGSSLHAQTSLRVAGLQQPVNIITDQWGVPHIYAQTEHDLFFAQGYYAARDRLFQFEVWRRGATGTWAEVLGAKELERDHGARLFQFRGDLEEEMAHYHPHGKEIITAFVAGVNAWIQQTRQNPALLSEEFRLLGFEPDFWTPAVVVSRHQGLLSNLVDEWKHAQALQWLSPQQLQDVLDFHPQRPQLELDPLIPRALLQRPVLRLYEAFRAPLRFTPDDLVGSVPRADHREYATLARQEEDAYTLAEQQRYAHIGSNNWVLSGRLTTSGYPLLANDPHRALSTPSLRYLAHLVGPGWNVIGGGEPVIPGISIGHNEYGAWGLTIYSTDAEDLYVYETHPEHPTWYKVAGAWRKMRIIKDTIKIKGQAPQVVELKYTHHGPVLYEDVALRKACAVRCAWLEVGGAPYLASLRMGQAKDWESFRLACRYSHIPAENMVWADRQGNIGWQAVGIAPIRRNHSGLVPVPGDGRFEWDGYLPINERPHVLNPAQGFWATANENVTPPDYPFWESVGFQWSDPYRGDRCAEVLGSGIRQGLPEAMALQTDYLLLPARQLVQLLKPLNPRDSLTRWARQELLRWNFTMEPGSVTATLYDAWARQLQQHLTTKRLPPPVRPFISLSTATIMAALFLPDSTFGADPLAGRDSLLLLALRQGLQDLQQRLGPAPQQWQYGQERYKHVVIRHPLSNALAPEARQRFDHGPLPRGGSAHTVGNTGAGFNQTHGATFRFIVDTGNWDHCMATNAPGQSGDVRHPHYRNLFLPWAQDQYFPLFYSPAKIAGVTYAKLQLEPQR